MSRQVEIPGGFATLREAADFRGKDRNVVKAAAMAATPTILKMPEVVREGPLEGETPEETAERLAPFMEGVPLDMDDTQALIQLRQATMVATLESWTLDLPLPTTMKAMGELPGDLYDALDAANGGITTAVANATNFDESPDKDSPTGGSSSSEEPLMESQPSLSTPTSLTDGDPTSGEDSSLEQ
jgi:hypothetical protein